LFFIVLPSAQREELAMSIAEWDPLDGSAGPEVDLEPEVEEKPVVIPRKLHRLAEVRQQQAVSHRNVARRLGLDMKTVRQQEEETHDLPLSLLYAWQQVLDVPIADLLIDNDGPISPLVLQRARMVKLMKTAAAIQEKADSNSMRRLVQMLMDQLIEIMPELKEVGPWHAVGQRRTLDDYGRVVERPVADEVFRRAAKQA
jgi:transcriptional regulator with XRE-family HTH domain